MSTWRIGTRMTITELDQYLDKYLSTLQLKDKSGDTKFVVELGRKYTKVIYESGRSRSVHAFVDNSNGDIYKPASWNGPAKGIRYNLFADFERLLQVCDIYGSYLYKR